MSTSTLAAAPPICLTCRRLPSFDHENWEEVLAVFAGAEVCPYRQHWRATPHPRFLPGFARTGYDDQSLWILAEFEDVDIFNAAKELNESAYRIGDVFEIFLRALPLPEYVEFHVTPLNQRLQLWWPYTKKAEHDADWKSHYLIEPHFESWTQVLQGENRWRVLTSIPYENLNSSTPQDGHEWLFSFSRYDYTRGKKTPVLSSTSLHTQSDFHRHHEWGRLVFCDKELLPES